MNYHFSYSILCSMRFMQSLINRVGVVSAHRIISRRHLCVRFVAFHSNARISAANEHSQAQVKRRAERD